MTTHESKLAEDLERRLQEHALQNKNKVYPAKIRSDALAAAVTPPLRGQRQTIQRAQYYTGDA